MDIDTTEYMSLAQAQNFLGVDLRTLNDYLARIGITSISDGQGRGQAHLYILRGDVARLATTYGIVRARDPHHLQLLVSPLVADRSPYTANAMRLLEEGARLAGRRLPSGAYIILAALGVNLVAQINLASSPQYIQQAFSVFRRPNVAQLLRDWVDMPAFPSARERCTLGFAMALEAARRAAGGRPIDWDILLWAALTKDRDVSAALSRSNSTSSGQSGQASAFLPTPTPSFFTQPRLNAVTQSEDMPARYEATTTLRYRTRHGVAMSDLITTLRSRTPGQVIVARGLYGSPLDRLAPALADILAWHQITDEADDLDCDYVVTQDIGNLHAAEKVGGGAPEALVRNIQVAREIHGALILTSGELLTHGDHAVTQASEDTQTGEGIKTVQAINDQLLGVIAGVRDVPIIIAHEDRDEEAYHRPITLNYVNCIVQRIRDQDKDHALHALVEYYRDVLRSEGFSLEEGALKQALALASTMYVETNGGFKRKALPYSVAGLVFDAAEQYTLEQKQGISPQTFARTARDNAKDLGHSTEGGKPVAKALELVETAMKTHSEDAQLVEDAEQLLEMWMPICQILLEVPGRMEALAANPLPTPDADELRPISSDMILAELFGSDKLSLQLWTAFQRDLSRCCAPLQAAVRQGH